VKKAPTESPTATPAKASEPDPDTAGKAHDPPDSPDPYAPPLSDGGRGAPWRNTQDDDETQAPGPIGVLRLGHRPGRDKRITTHVCLAARAFGADIIYIHETDSRVVAAVEDVVDRFGGPFIVKSIDSWRKVVGAWKAAGAQIVHLTMYGLPLDEALERTTPNAPTLFVVGAEKVPPELYQSADVNLAVGNQPHSELAAIAVVLDRFLAGRWAEKTFHGRVQVSPRERGKAVSPRNTP
jgi:tRNA (cytidine56-2'-O)-methyltransferase